MLLRRFGRRGIFAMLFGLAWTLDGAATMVQVHDRVLPWVPTWAVGLMWLVCGVVALADAARPGGKDTLAYAALALPAFTEGVGASIVLGILTTNATRPLYWEQAAIWLFIVAAILVEAYAPEAVPAPAARTSSEDEVPE